MLETQICLTTLRCLLNHEVRIISTAIYLAISALLVPWTSFGGESLTLSWTNNLLTVSSSALPTGKLEIWYLEAFCRKGSTHRDWNQTVLPHKTRLILAEPRHLRFQTDVEPNVEVSHEVIAREDEIEFQFELRNRGKSDIDRE